MGMQGGGGMQQNVPGMQGGMMQGPGYNQMGPQGGKPGYPGMQGGESHRVHTAGTPLMPTGTRWEKSGNFLVILGPLE